MNRKQLKAHSLQQLLSDRSYWLMLLAFKAVGIIASIFSTYELYLSSYVLMTRGSQAYFRFIDNQRSSLLLTLCMIVLDYYITHILLMKIHQEPIRFETIVAKTNLTQLIQFVVLSIWIAIKTFLWSLLLIVPGIIKSLEYYYVPYIFLDDQCTFRQAFTTTKTIITGHKWEFFILQLSFILWFILEFLTLNIASIFVNPYFETTLVFYYQQLRLANLPIQQEFNIESQTEE